MTNMQPFTNPASVSGAAAAGTPLYGLQTQRVLGESASGPTWLAFQLSALEGGAIAVKRYNARFTKYVMGDPPVLERLAAFQGKVVPGLPTLLRAGITRDELLILMEGNDGESLDLVMPSGGFDRETAIRLIGQLSGALATMHAGGVLHLNVHPGAIVLYSGGRHASFVDWGHTVPQVRMGESIGGLPGFGFGGIGYASAELLAGAGPDASDDVFSMACVAYELLTGQHPFDRRSPGDAIEQGIEARPIVNFDLTRNATLLRALTLHRDNRSVSMDELAEAFGAPRPRIAAGARPTLRDGLRQTLGLDRGTAERPAKAPATPTAPRATGGRAPELPREPIHAFDAGPGMRFDRPFGSGLNLGMDEHLKEPLIAGLNQGGTPPGSNRLNQNAQKANPGPRRAEHDARDDARATLDFERNDADSGTSNIFKIAIGSAAALMLIAVGLVWLKVGGPSMAAPAITLTTAPAAATARDELAPTPPTVAAPTAEITSSTATIESVPVAPRGLGREREQKPFARAERARPFDRERDTQPPPPAVVAAPIAPAPATAQPVATCPTCSCPSLREKRFLAEQPLSWDEAAFFMKACADRG